MSFSLTSWRMAMLLGILLLCARSTTALPSGTVGCEPGMAAVSGLHTTQQTVLTGPLSLDDIEFHVNGIALQPGVPHNIDIGTNYTWKLITAGTFFRGFLVRLGRGNNNVDTRSSLISDSTTAQVAQVACLDSYWVGGITHNSNVLKNIEEGILNVPLPSQNLSLDVTVVIQNRNGYSIFYYSGFIIHANSVAVDATGTDSSFDIVEIQSGPTYTPYFPPPTAAPSVTLITAPPVTAPPVTAPPVTVPPFTAPPVTAIPYTSAPVPVPVTAPPVTAPPVTAPPVTAPPIPYSAPITAAPISLAPITNAPITAAPITYAPISAAPITHSPITHAPITSAPMTTFVPPMAAPMVAATPAPALEYVFLRYPTCSEDAPCMECQGDCDTNADCAGALECFHRPQDDLSPIPGCAGEGVSGRDYCYMPHPNSLRPRMPECTADLPCGMCEGDCDDSSECAPGLTCFTRGTGDLTPIFGCAGLGIAGLDYCYNASAVNFAALNSLGLSDREDNVTDSNATISIVAPLDANMSEPVMATPTSTPPAPTAAIPAPTTAALVASPTKPENEDFSSNDQGQLSDTGCTAAAPCGRCEGDCQSDDTKCAGSLTCYVRPDHDITRVLGCGGSGTPGTDYCWLPVANALAIRARACTTGMPCLKCEGSCEDDNECDGDLKCFRRRDLSVVPGCGNGFFGVSFCWDPSDLNFGGRRMLRH